MSGLGVIDEKNLINFFSSSLSSSISVAGDKSITHRAIMFASIADGISYIKTEVLGRDNFATVRIFQQLGVSITLDLTSEMFKIAQSESIENIHETKESLCTIVVKGQGFEGLKEPSGPLDCGNSGTTARLLCGLFSALPFSVTLTGDESLSQRPFARVTKPLSAMGAQFQSQNEKDKNETKLPLTITGAPLHAITYDSPKSSAQVKSSLMLAGMHAEGVTTVTEPYISRNHTEIMLSAMGAQIDSRLDTERVITTIKKLEKPLQAINVEIPGDISAAMFFIVAGLINPYAPDHIVVKNVGINPTRSACLDILRRMGGRIELHNQREQCGELVSDICVYKSDLNGVLIDKKDVAFAVDEIPILSVAASFAKGTTRISGAEELRVKESDRLSMTALLLKAYGVSVDEKPDGLIIEGGGHSTNLTGVELGWKACGDHRISMCGAVMEYVLGMELKIYDMKSIETSFPSFLSAFVKVK